MLQAANFFMITGHSYKMGFDEILCRYVPEYERPSIIVEAHVRVVGENYAGRVIVQKILRVGIWWPIVHKDSKIYCRVCDAC